MYILWIDNSSCYWIFYQFQINKIFCKISGQPCLVLSKLNIYHHHRIIFKTCRFFELETLSIISQLIYSFILHFIQKFETMALKGLLNWKETNPLALLNDRSFTRSCWINVSSRCSKKVWIVGNINFDCSRKNSISFWKNGQNNCRIPKKRSTFCLSNNDRP